MVGATVNAAATSACICIQQDVVIRRLTKQTPHLYEHIHVLIAYLQMWTPRCCSVNPTVHRCCISRRWSTDIIRHLHIGTGHCLPLHWSLSHLNKTIHNIPLITIAHTTTDTKGSNCTMPLSSVYHGKQWTIFR